MWSSIYHKFKYTFKKNSLNEYFKAFLHYFCVYSLSGFIMATWWTCSSFLALAEDRVTILSVLKIFHGKDFWPLFESGTNGYPKCWWCHVEWHLLEFVCGLLLGNWGYQIDRKKDLWPEQNRTPLVIRAPQNYKLASLREW